MDQTEINGAFKLLGLKNSVVAGVEGGQEIFKSDPVQLHDQQINTVPSTSLLIRIHRQPFSGTGYIASIVHTKVR